MPSAETLLEREIRWRKEDIVAAHRKIVATQRLLLDLPMFTEWTERDLKTYIARRIVIETAGQIRASLHRRSREVGMPPISLWRLECRWSQVQRTGNHRLLLPKKSSGRPRKA